MHYYAPSIPEARLAVSYPAPHMRAQTATSPDKTHLALQMVTKGLGKGREECHRQGKGDLAVVSQSCNSR